MSKTPTNAELAKLVSELTNQLAAAHASIADQNDRIEHLKLSIQVRDDLRSRIVDGFTHQKPKPRAAIPGLTVYEFNGGKPADFPHALQIGPLQRGITK